MKLEDLVLKEISHRKRHCMFRLSEVLEPSDRETERTEGVAGPEGQRRAAVGGAHGSVLQDGGVRVAQQCGSTEQS